MFISYAQNSEDIVLWRVLGHVEHGTYVDVGAADPTEYSVTKAFYDRGWSGVNVEPSPEFVAKLRAERMRDTTFALCAGEAEGPVTLHHVPGTGLSTVSDDFLEVIANKKFDVVDLESEVQRLDRILESAGLTGKDIHFLKVDVEGAEETVLRSIDLTVWRPWVLVVEATEPLSTSQTHASWDSMLLDNGYVFCLFDGLNRFYAASEHSELVPAMSYPAGVFDQPYTVGTGQNELAARAEALIAERDALAEGYDQLHAKYENSISGYGRLEGELKTTLHAYEKLEREHLESIETYGRLHDEYENALDGYHRLHEEYENALDDYHRLHEEYETVLAAYQRVENTVGETVAALEEKQRQLDEATASLALQLTTSGELSEQLATTQARLAAVERSTSWRITRPLRAARHPGKG